MIFVGITKCYTVSVTCVSFPSDEPILVDNVSSNYLELFYNYNYMNCYEHFLKSNKFIMIQLLYQIILCIYTNIFSFCYFINSLFKKSSYMYCSLFPRSLPSENFNIYQIYKFLLSFVIFFCITLLFVNGLSSNLDITLLKVRDMSLSLLE